jgi:hypothetical protein
VTDRGSSFEDFLKEEGLLEASIAIAVKRVLAWQIKKERFQWRSVSSAADAVSSIPIQPKVCLADR